MGSKILVVLCLVAFASVINAGSVAFIKKCKSDDSQCIKESTQGAIPEFANGIPDLRIEKLDPIHIEKLDASSNELKLILTDIDISGIKECEAKNMKRDPANSKIYVKSLCTVNVDGQYEISGRLLFLPIEGKGKIHAVLRKLLISVDADVVEKTGKDGKVHWDVKSWTHKYELKDKATLELDNLFEGNEVLARAVRDLLSSSPNEIIGEVGPPIIKAILSKVVKVVDRFFKEVPAEELALD